MNLTAVAGTIERRILVNYRVDPTVLKNILPEPFAPALVNGYAIAGICLIQLNVHPTWLPRWAGFRSQNGAHRIAVVLPDGSDGVYIPRRDTDSRLNTLIGGRLFPGRHHLADIGCQEDEYRISVELTSRDRSTHVSVSARTSNVLPDGSVFQDLRHVSDFFERGSLGYSDTPGGECYDGLELRTADWAVQPLVVEQVESSFFDDPGSFPLGSVELDNALLLRNIQHTWHSRPSLPTEAKRILRL